MGSTGSERTAPGVERHCLWTAPRAPLGVAPLDIRARLPDDERDNALSGRTATGFQWCSLAVQGLTPRTDDHQIFPDLSRGGFMFRIPAILGTILLVGCAQTPTRRPLGVCSFSYLGPASRDQLGGRGTFLCSSGLEGEFTRSSPATYTGHAFDRTRTMQLTIMAAPDGDLPKSPFCTADRTEMFCM